MSHPSHPSKQQNFFEIQSPYTGQVYKFDYSKMSGKYSATFELDEEDIVQIVLFEMSQYGLFKTLFPDMFYILKKHHDEHTITFIRVGDNARVKLSYDDKSHKFHLTSSVIGLVEIMKDKILSVIPTKKDRKKMRKFEEMKRLKELEENKSKGDDDTDDDTDDEDFSVIIGKKMYK
jgi:hypothetical protein